MSVTTIVYTVIGVQVAIRKFTFGTRREMTCDHIPDTWGGARIERIQFCPKCGKPVVQKDCLIPQFDDVYDFGKAIKYALQQMQLNLPWIWAETSAEVGHPTYCLGIGHSINANNNEYHQVTGLPSVETLEIIKNALKVVLSPYDLYDETTFGIHSVLYYG